MMAWCEGLDRLESGLAARGEMGRKVGLGRDGDNGCLKGVW